MHTHTIGPWYATNAGNDYQGLVIDEATGANIAVSYDKTHATLIAAAPEMLEALKLALILHPHNVTFQQAIAKAEGRG